MRTLAQKKNTITFYKKDRGEGGGVNSPQKPKICKKMEALRFLQQISYTGLKDISCNDVDSDSGWGGGGVQIFFIKPVQYGTF